MKPYNIVRKPRKTPLIHRAILRGTVDLHLTQTQDICACCSFQDYYFATYGPWGTQKENCVGGLSWPWVLSTTGMIETLVVNKNDDVIKLMRWKHKISWFMFIFNPQSVEDKNYLIRGLRKIYVFWKFNLHPHHCQAKHNLILCF